MKTKPEDKRSASCPVCGKRVRVIIPKQGDGSVDILTRHRTSYGVQCAGSRRIVNE